jgi:hypothetical protein
LRGSQQTLDIARREIGNQLGRFQLWSVCDAANLAYFVCIRMEPDPEASMDILALFTAFNAYAREVRKPTVSLSAFVTALHQYAHVCDTLAVDRQQVVGQRLC